MNNIDLEKFIIGLSKVCLQSPLCDVKLKDVINMALYSQNLQVDDDFKLTVLQEEPNFKVGDWIVRKDGTSFGQNNKHVAQIINVTNDRPCRYWLSEDEYISYYIKDFRKWTINDAKDGDVLATENFIFIFKSIDSSNGVHYYCRCKMFNWDDDDDWMFDVALSQSLMGRVDNSFSNYSPASKEQRGLLFKKMHDAGYKWNAKKKELKKIESKVNVGDWVVSPSGVYLHIDAIRDGRYQVSSSSGFSSDDWPLDMNIYHRFTIKDAKDGDVLAVDNDTIVVFKDLYNATTFHSYCHLENNIFDISKDNMPDWWEGEGFYPATKEQRDILFQKMKEAGYKWNAVNKELIKRPLDDLELALYDYLSFDTCGEIPLQQMRKCAIARAKEIREQLK